MFNQGTIVDNLFNIIKLNKKALYEIDNLVRNLCWSAPEIIEYRFWFGHESGNWPGIYQIIKTNFEDINKYKYPEKYNESRKVKIFFIQSYNKYLKIGFN